MLILILSVYDFKKLASCTISMPARSMTWLLVILSWLKPHAASSLDR